MVLGQAETVGAGWRHIDKFLERIRGVTIQDVQRVARQYLTPDTRTVGTLLPIAPQGESAAVSDRHSGR
jgi:zinc protease